MTAPMAEAERRRLAKLANMRQELLAPVVALVGYGELLVEEAAQQNRAEVTADLARILSAAQDLHAMVEGLLDTTSAVQRDGDADLEVVQARLRHDLRTPLNAIKGYGELVLEDMVDPDDRLRLDLEPLLREADGLLARVDGIIDFVRRDDAAALADDAPGAVATMVANLVRTVRSIETDTVLPHETGRVLVVDDNASNRDLLFRRLTRDGHEVVRADSGQRALDLLRGEAFDLILLDLLMPELNGFEVLARLKADPELHEIPVIMISGLQETDSVIRCIAAGAEDYLAKPFNPVLLRARINACLERKRWRDRERRYVERIELEKDRHAALLRNILPGQIIARLNAGEDVIADRIESATIMFADLVGFTAIASRLAPTELVDNLNRIVSAFDALCHEHGIEKIKTIGDAYMAAAGVPDPRPDHAPVMIEFALAMLATLARVSTKIQVPVQIRIGIHTGPVVAGVIGSHRFIYDIWGETVNLASRLETHGMPGRVHVSEATCRLATHQYTFEPRGMIEVKGIGKVQTAFVTGRL